MEIIEKALQKLLDNRVARHLAFWFIIIASSLLIYEHYLGNWTYAVIRSVIHFPISIFAAYLLIYYQIPRYIYQKRYVYFIIHFIIVAYLLSITHRILTVHVYEAYVRSEIFKQEPVTEILTDVLSLLKGYFSRIYATPFFLAILKLIKDRFNEQQKQRQLEKEKMAAELNFLKAQIHPHFLFNTLNNLYLLTLKKSDKAPETVIKLSEIMDYMLYQCNESLVPLEKEIKLLENYIGLEMLRYGDRLELNFEKNVDNMQTKVAPLLLLSMVENAFKHGASADIGKPKIEIGLIAVAGSLSFRVFNTKSKVIQTDERDYKKGIGVSNTKRQLELIYPNQHTLTVDEQDHSFTVDLFIDLNQQNP